MWLPFRKASLFCGLKTNDLQPQTAIHCIHTQDFFIFLTFDCLAQHKSRQRKSMKKINVHRNQEADRISWSEAEIHNWLLILINNYIHLNRTQKHRKHKFLNTLIKKLTVLFVRPHLTLSSAYADALHQITNYKTHLYGWLMPVPARWDKIVDFPTPCIPITPITRKSGWSSSHWSSKTQCNWSESLTAIHYIIAHRKHINAISG